MRILRVTDLSEMTGYDKGDIYRMANRADDPLPLRVAKGKLKGAFCFEDEFWEWMRRNAVPWNERRSYAPVAGR